MQDSAEQLKHGLDWKRTINDGERALLQHILKAANSFARAWLRRTNNNGWRRLLEAARGRYPALALSVREGNPAVRLYERFGFVEERRVVNRVGGASLVMRLPLGIEERDRG